MDKPDHDTMLDAFFRVHDYLVAHNEAPIRRLLMDEIDWSARLIAIKGGRGVGKTDFLLARAKEIEAKDRELKMQQENTVRKTPLRKNERTPCSLD